MPWDEPILWMAHIRSVHRTLIKLRLIVAALPPPAARHDRMRHSNVRRTSSDVLDVVSPR